MFATYHSTSHIGDVLGHVLNLNNTVEVKSHVQSCDFIGPPKTAVLKTDHEVLLSGKVVDRLERIGWKDGESPEVLNMIDHTMPYENEYLTVESVLVHPQAVSRKEQSIHNEFDDIDMCMAFICKFRDRVVLKDLKSLSESINSAKLTRSLAYELSENKQHLILTSGHIVEPNDLVENAKKQPPFLVVDCPTEHHLKPLVNCKAFEKFYDPIKYEDKVQVVVHFAPQHIEEQREYRQWMKRFGEDTCHIMLNGKVYGPAPSSLMKQQFTHHQLHPTMFPLLHEQEKGRETIIDENMVYPDSLQTFVLSKTEGQSKFFKYSELNHGSEHASEKPFTSFDKENILASPALETIRKMKEEAKKSRRPKDKREFPEIVFLGTQSTNGSILRSNSCILVHINENECAILDCGRYSTLQLRALYGREGAKQILRKLKFVYISHLHIDHRWDVRNIVNERKQAFKEIGIQPDPLKLLCTAAFNSKSCVKQPLIIPPGDSYSLKSLELISKHKWLQCEVAEELGLKQIKLMDSDHPAFAFMVAFVFPNNFHLVYTADTRPLKELKRIAAGCDLLIHEATFPDGDQRIAAVYSHSTPSEALAIAKHVGAKHTVLTHQSARYTTLMPYPEKFWNDPSVFVAFDFMRLRPCDLAECAQVKPLLKVLYADPIAPSEARTKSYRKNRAKLNLELMIPKSEFR